MTPNGYGIFTEGGRRSTAHPIARERIHGPLPTGMHLDHLCRQRACVNPQHLEPVPCAVNVQRGLSSPLTPDLVEQIRSAAGTQREIAERFGISQPTVSRVRRGVTWAGDRRSA